MEKIRDIDFCKYHAFFLEYQKCAHKNKSHIVRPCTKTYKQILSIQRNEFICLEAAVLSFDSSMPLPEVLMNCALCGISIDFIDIIADDGKHYDGKIVQAIDMHKEDVSQMLEAIDAPRHYVALNVHKSNLKYLVVDRYAQDSKIKFLNGKYSNHAVVAGFSKHKDALSYCMSINEGN